MTCEDCFRIVEKCRNKTPWEGGILLQEPGGNCFINVSFGDGTNADTLEEGCDDYLYLSIHKIQSDLTFEEVDGGQLDFNRAASRYAGDIRFAVYDGLELLGYEMNTLPPTAFTAVRKLGK